VGITYQTLIPRVVEVEVVAYKLSKAPLSLMSADVDNQYWRIIVEEDRVWLGYGLWVPEPNLQNVNACYLQQTVWQGGLWDMVPSNGQCIAYNGMRSRHLQHTPAR